MSSRKNAAETSAKPETPAKPKPESPVKPKPDKKKFLRSLHPGEQRTERWMTPLGLFLRLVPTVLFAAGLWLFTDNAFGFESKKLLMLGLIVGSVALTMGMCWNRIVKIVGLALWGLAAAGGIVWVCMNHDPIAYAVQLVTGFFNTGVSHMMKLGYSTLYIFLIDTELTPEVLAARARVLFAVVTVIVSVICAACTARRVKVLPMALIAAVDYFVIFMYNISYSKWGFALSLAGIAGILCQKMADNAQTYGALNEAGGKETKTPEKTDGAAEAAAENPEKTEVPAKAGKVKAKKTPLTDEERDARRAEHKKDIRGFAVGGICSAFASVLILLILALPASKVKNIWKTYESIDTVMETIRAYEVALITGEDMQISDLGLTGAAEILEARSSLATPRYFTGKGVLEIQSNVNIPVYLRSWVSTTYTDDKWYVANEEQRDEFRELFGEEFRAEDLTTRFYRDISEKLVRYNNPTSYANHEDDGYITTLISLKNLGVSGNILFLPERFDSLRSLFDYGQAENAYGKRWINYFDGIAYSRAFHKGAKYSAVAYLPLYKDEDFALNLNAKRLEYSRFINMLEYLGDDIVKYEPKNTDIGSTVLFSELQDTYAELSEEEREVFREEVAENVRYNEYIQDSTLYTSLTDDEELNARIAALAKEIVCSNPLPDTGISCYRDPAHEEPLTFPIDLTDYYCTVWNDLVNAVEIRGSDHSLIDTHYYIKDFDTFADIINIEYFAQGFAQEIAEYLADSMTYTLDPTPAEEGDTASAMERFLFDTKEGYCVQYATAATLLLRSLGIPARYVEGYIAPKFSRNEMTKEDGKVGNYVCTVRDYNAHAWVEIYLSNYGWMMEEVTTPYYSGMYDPYEIQHYTPRDNDDIHEELPPEEEIEIVPKEKTFWEKWGDTVITLGIIAAVLAILIFVLMKYLSDRAGQLYRHVQDLRSSARRQVPADKRAATASSLYDNMRKLVKLYGMRPVTGETPAGFVKRLDMRFRVSGERAQDILPIIEKSEFGDAAITEEELAVLAGYMMRLEDVIRGETNPLRMIWITYFLGLCEK